MSKYTFTFVLGVTLLGACAASVAQESKWIAVLKSDASRFDKATACRLLAKEGTKESVPVLAGLLGNEELSHMARYALEPIRDASVDVALRDAVGRLKGMPLVGVIGSIGVRRDAQAVPALVKLLADPDTEVVQAAARALGSIGTPEAVQGLGAALPGSTGYNQLSICEGLFRCAESLAAQGQGAASQAIYDQLRAVKDAPHQVRAGALRGAILARQNEGIPLLVEAIRGDDYLLSAAAARTALEMPSPEVTAALVKELPNLSADKQVLIANTLGYRHDVSAGEALAALVGAGPKPVRLAAISNVTQLGYAAVLPKLAELALGDDAELAAAARSCLSNFPGQEADATIEAMLAHADVKVRGLAVEMIAVRRAGEAAPVLLKAAADNEEAVRLVAHKALRDQATLAELPALLDILVKAKSTAESQAAESTLGALCARLSEPVSGNVVIGKAVYGVLDGGPSADVTQKVADLVRGGALAVAGSNDNFGDPAPSKPKTFRVDYTVNGASASKTVAEGDTVTFTAIATPPALVDGICDAMTAAKGGAKCALLRTLRSAGGAKALEAVVAATSDSSADVKDTALRTLCDWPTPDALPKVADLVKNPPSKTMKVLALRGFIRLVPLDSVPDAQKLTSLKDALGQAERVEEKRAILSAVGNLASPEALAVVAAFLEDASLKEEACLAAVTIAEQLGSPSAETVAAMKTVVKVAPNTKHADRANAILGKAKQ